MRATLAELMARKGLGLRVIVGDDLDVPVRWVATSEHADPTEYLDGGELLLTTGMHLPHGADLDAYVDRLVGAGVVALGFGLGPVHEVVPEPLVAACRERSLTLLEIDRPTPFISVSKAVSDLLSEMEYAGLMRTAKVRQNLTRAALRGGAEQVVDRLAREAEGWVILLTPGGAVRRASPRRARERVVELAEDVERVRSAGLRGSASLTRDDERIEILPIGARGRTRGILILGAPKSYDAGQPKWATLAAEVLTLELERELDRRLSERTRNDVALDMLERRDLTTDRLSTLLGPPFDADTLVAVVIDIPKRSLGTVREALEGSASGTFVAQFGERLALFTDAADFSGITLTKALPKDVEHAIGVSAPVEPSRAHEAVHQADRAATAAALTGVELVHVGESIRPSFATMLASDDARMVGRTLLAPLEQADGAVAGELVQTLIAWLGHNGHAESAADALAIHRHTLRHRLRRIETILDHSLDDATLRSELWMACLALHPQLSSTALKRV